MPRERHLWSPTGPFRLPNGAVAEGRPDLVQLLTAREPHEKLVKAGAGEIATAMREKAAEKQHNLQSSSSNKPNRSDLTEFIGMEVPSAMLGSTFAKLKESINEVQVAQPNTEPLNKPRPPSRVGIFRSKDTTVQVRHTATLHSAAQHSPTRTTSNFDTLNTTNHRPTSPSPPLTSPFRSPNQTHNSRPGTTTSGTMGMMGTTDFLPPLNSTAHQPSNAMMNATNTMNAPIPRYVRIGVSVTAAPGAPTTLMIEDTNANGNSRSLSRSITVGPTGSRMVGGGMYNQTLPTGSLPTRGGGGGFNTTFDHPNADGTNGLQSSSMISFRHATADLPTAATKAVRQLLEDHRPVTVANIHQRRPPYLDMGPPRTEGDDDIVELHPDNFNTILRKNPSDTFRQPTRPFITGCPPPWQKGKTAAFQTFDVSIILFQKKNNFILFFVQSLSRCTPRN